MKHRFLAFICVLALLIAMLPAGAASVTSVQAATETYDVGYASKNLNPWVSSDFDHTTDVGTAVFLENPEEVTDKKIYPHLFSQTGNQIDWESVVTQLHDDNGDGTVDHGDGIFATCTAVTYGKGTAEEKTVLFITTDTMKAWSSLVSAVRSKITASDWGKALGIQADQIMVSSNHTHSGPALTGESGFADSHIDSTVFDTDEKKAALKTDRKNYYNWVVDRIVAAAEESVADQAPATMSKGAVNAQEATAALDYNSGNGYHMNTIRHYQRSITATKKLFGSIPLDSETIYSIYANTSVPSEQKLYDALSEHGFEKAELFNPEQFLTDTSYTTAWSTTDNADNNMYVLRFEFENPTKDPVVFVNWRAHSTMNSGILSHSVLSGDYATGLRKTLADEGYRAAFFLGAAGNVVPHPTSDVYTESGKLVKSKMDWLYEATDKNDSSLSLDVTKKTFVYGRMLAEIAQYCMEKTDMVDTPVGEISTYRTSWKSVKQKYNDQLLAAAIALRAEVMSATGWTQAEFDSNYKTHLKNKASTYFPYYYKPSGETTAILNSRLHFNSVYSQAKTVLDNGKAVADYNSAIELNTIMLGKNVAFVTSPNELADYYHDFTGDITSHTAAEKEAHNDWFTLEDDTYGMPFVLGYSNQNSGYIAGWLDHQANSETHATITGLGAEGYMLYSPGTYESMTSSFAAGQGEELIKVYDRMLDIVNGEYDIIAPCPHCSPDEDVTWKPLFAEDGANTHLVGHHYLVEDLPRFVDNQTQKTFTEGDTLCLNLNGHALETEGRSFNVGKGVEVSIFDTPFENAGSGGVVRSFAEGNNPGGGTVSVAAGGIFNLYGGTMEFVKEDDATYGTGIGGIFSLTGTLNMYGGTVKGAELVDSSYKFGSDGCGGAIYMYGGAVLNVQGGTITSGTLPTTNDKPTEGAALVANGPCVYMSASTSKITLANDANVEDIYYRYNSGSNLTISGTYTGTAGLTFDSDVTITDNMDIGNSSSANLAGATITCTNNPMAKVYVHKTDLKLSNITANTTAMAYNSNGQWAYDSLADAAAKFTDGYIQLTKDQTGAATISQDVYLDLAGHNVTGQVTVNDGKTLYVMDSETDDYTVADEKYGKISSFTGNIIGVPVESTLAEDGYLKVTETDGISFHRINLQISAMSLRSNAVDSEGNLTPGLYYKSYFAGDEKVAGKVEKFGVALSATGVPDASTLSPQNASVFEGFQPGENANEGNSTGTLLKGVMKTTNKDLINNRNANIDVYGRAYVLLDDGTYLFGESVDRTLRTQVEMIEDLWKAGKLDEDQKAALVEMCSEFYPVVRYWNIPSILEAVPEK